MFVSIVPFYYATLEQYYTGELIMPRINGVDEGSIVYALVCFISAIWGCRNCWGQKYNILGLGDNTPFMYLSYLVAIALFFAIIDK